MADYPIINGRIHTSNMVQMTMLGVPYFGVKEINYKAFGRDVQNVYALGDMPYGQAVGQIHYEPVRVVAYNGTIRAMLAAMRGSPFGIDTPVTITSSFKPTATGTQRAYTDVLEQCTMMDIPEIQIQASNNDGIAIEIQFQPFSVLIDTDAGPWDFRPIF